MALGELDPLVVETPKEAIIEASTADGDEDNNNLVNETPTKANRTPFKSKWLVTLIKSAISETPNLSYKQIRMLVSPYIKSKFLSDSLLQNAQCQARMEVFGNPDDNVQLISALVAEMRSRDHDVLVVEHNACEVYKMLEALILSEEVNKRKTSGGDKMRKADKISFMKNWKVKNIQMLIDSGLDKVIQGPNVPKFVSGVFFSTSGARTTVPHLQQVYQADAAHMSFGKYTLYSCYGTTANGTTSAVGFGIHFGNESKEDWEIFWNFVKHTHASLDDYKNTLITNQAKGLVELIYQVLSAVGHFHCSYHRRQNILKVVRVETSQIPVSGSTTSA
jgi:hypothetical protein